MIQSLLDESDLSLSQIDAIVMVSGPGSFTGLRIGSAVAQGLSFGADIPIIRISSLMMQARAAFGACGQREGTESVFYTCMHAREDEFYFACYQDDGVSQPRALIEDQISDTKSILNLLRDQHDQSCPHYRSGNGWLQRTLQDAGEGDQALALVSGAANAATLCALGEYALAAGLTDRADDAVPVYLKEDMAYRKS
ncbi:hypothetical protein LCGC14_0020970 [marine sediment metagenome]|uniref:Gcp-like domain-containing protein n=2 Tax=root TaxID=1 RepID=A0A0F9YEH8_9ZZZZ